MQRDEQLEQILLSLRDQVANATAVLRDEVRRGMEPVAASVAELRQRLDAVEEAVGRFGTTIAERLTAAIDRAREEAPDVDELLRRLRAELEHALADAPDRLSAPVEELRQTVENEMAKLKEQVAYGMAALLRQVDAIRGAAPGPHAPSRIDRRRPEAGAQGAGERRPDGPSTPVG